MTLIHRIALTGAQGTGKSTLARQLAATLGESGDLTVALHTGLGEFAESSRIATGMAADAETVRALARWHVRREVDLAGMPAHEADTVVILDRCLLDTLAYAEVLGCLPAAELQTLREMAGRSGRAFDQFLFLRITSDYPVTSPRDETPQFRRAIEQAIAEAGAALELSMLEVRFEPPALGQVCEDVAARLRSAMRPRAVSEG